jgi:hypothetical protein
VSSDRVTTYPASPTIPARPAVYIWDPDLPVDSDWLISQVQDERGWPEPAPCSPLTRRAQED